MPELKAKFGKMIFKPISVDPVISEGTKKKTVVQTLVINTRGDRQVAGGLFSCLGREKRMSQKKDFRVRPLDMPLRTRRGALIKPFK